MEQEIMQLLKQIRIKNNIKTSELAEKMGISIYVLYQYESEKGQQKRSLDISTFFKWCEALGKKPQVIIGTIYERRHPRSHTSKKKRLEKILAKPYGELSQEEKDFLSKNVTE